MSPQDFKGIYTLSSVISLLLYAYILTFLHKLEASGCACAMDWRRNYALGYMSYMIAYTCLTLYNALQPTKKPSALTAVASFLAPLNLVLGILFVVFTFQYVHRLEKEKCQCSRTLGRAIMTLVAAIDAAVFALLGLIFLISLISIMLGFQRK